MTLQPIPSEFSHIRGKFDFLFYQCTLYFNFELCQIELSPDVIPHGLGDEVDSILSKSCFKKALKIYVAWSKTAEK
jgi:hypothetical protein